MIVIVSERGGDEKRSTSRLPYLHVVIVRGRVDLAGEPDSLANLLAENTSKYSHGGRCFGQVALRKQYVSRIEFPMFAEMWEAGSFSSTRGQRYDTLRDRKLVCVR